MVFDTSVSMTWILFLALFPIRFFWLRRASRIVVNCDFSDVAVKRGESPPNPEQFAPSEKAINLMAGAVIVCVVVAMVSDYWEYSTCSAIVGIAIWCKFFASFALSRHAHAKWDKAKA